MISKIDEEKIDQWLKNFQKNYGDTMNMNNTICSLAYELCNDIPFGYEASHRLANWLFCYLNAPKIPKNILMQIQSKMHQQQCAKQRLIEAFSNYEQYTGDITTFIVGIDEQ